MRGVGAPFSPAGRRCRPALALLATGCCRCPAASRGGLNAGCLYGRVRYAAPYLGRRLSEGSDGSYVVRRIREHGVLAAVAVPPRHRGLARSVRCLCRAESLDLPAGAPVDAAARARGTCAWPFNPSASTAACSRTRDLRLARNRARWRRFYRRFRPVIACDSGLSARDAVLSLSSLVGRCRSRDASPSSRWAATYDC